MPCSCCLLLFSRGHAFKKCKMQACVLSHVWPLLTQASKAALTAMRQQDKDRRRVQLSYAEFVRLVVRTLEVEREAGRLCAYTLSADEAKASAHRGRSAARAQHGQDGTGACQYINGQVVWKKIFYVSSGREKVVDMWRLETSCLVQARHMALEDSECFRRESEATRETSAW